MKMSIWLGVFTSLLLALPLHAEYRAWTNTEGVKIEAQLVKAEGDNVTLRLHNGKVTTFPQAKLSDEDREFIKANASAVKAAEEAAAAPKVDADRKARWLTKMDRAKEEAAETGLPILVLFTGTSWCPYCVKLENEVFSQKEFKTFADQNLVLLILDFGPGGSSKNRKDGELAQEFGVSGFPKYFLIDAAGKKLDSGGYHGGINPEKFAGWVKGATGGK